MQLLWAQWFDAEEVAGTGKWPLGIGVWFEQQEVLWDTGREIVGEEKRDHTAYRFDFSATIACKLPSVSPRSNLNKQKQQQL